MNYQDYESARYGFLKVTPISLADRFPEVVALALEAADRELKREYMNELNMLTELNMYADHNGVTYA